MKIKDNINRLLLLLICLGTLLCCLPFDASANESEENIWGDIKWSTDGGYPYHIPCERHCCNARCRKL